MDSSPDHSTRVHLAYDSLQGLSVGDALGAQFFVPGRSAAQLAAGRIPIPPWRWTDDTEMACSVVIELRERRGIDPAVLAAAFARRFEPDRGYGPGTVVVLRHIRDGVPWPQAADSAFGGRGSYGNGAAMRVAPLGAYLAGDTEAVIEQARRSAVVTHSHPEGVAGAVAVALAAAHAAALRLADAPTPPAGEFLDAVLPRVPEGATRDAIGRARELVGASPTDAAYELGNGSQVTAQDTVPFAMWVAAGHLGDYPHAIVRCVDAGGDVDTTAAIVGGIVASYTGVGERGGVSGVPHQWLDAREPLPPWLH